MFYFHIQTSSKPLRPLLHAAYFILSLLFFFLIRQSSLFLSDRDFPKETLLRQSIKKFKGKITVNLNLDSSRTLRSSSSY